MGKWNRIKGRVGPNIKAKGGKKARRVIPKNEKAYMNCKAAIKKFLNNPSKKTYAQFQRAYIMLAAINPTAAWSLKKLFDKQLFDRALREEDFK